MWVYEATVCDVMLFYINTFSNFSLQLSCSVNQALVFLVSSGSLSTIGRLTHHPEGRRGQNGSPVGCRASYIIRQPLKLTATGRKPENLKTHPDTGRETLHRATPARPGAQTQDGGDAVVSTVAYGSLFLGELIGKVSALLLPDTSLSVGWFYSGVISESQRFRAPGCQSASDVSNTLVAMETTYSPHVALHL